MISVGYVTVIKPSGFKYKINREDAHLLSFAVWGDNGRGYVRGKQKYLHRMVANAPANMQIDHINGDKSDNRRENLRVCTRVENSFNRPANKSRKTGKFKGVYPNGKCGRWWCAKITMGDKKIWLGNFKTEKDAAIAYNNEIKKFHGEFAVLNEIPE